MVLAILSLLTGLLTVSVGGWFFLVFAVPCLILGRIYLKKAKQS